MYKLILNCFFKIFDIQQMIINTHRIWKNFDEQTQLRPLIEKLPKPLHSLQQTQQMTTTNSVQSSVHIQ